VKAFTQQAVNIGTFRHLRRCHEPSWLRLSPPGWLEALKRKPPREHCDPRGTFHDNGYLIMPAADQQQLTPGAQFSAPALFSFPRPWVVRRMPYPATTIDHRPFDSHFALVALVIALHHISRSSCWSGKLNLSQASSGVRRASRGVSRLRAKASATSGLNSNPSSGSGSTMLFIVDNYTTAPEA